MRQAEHLSRFLTVRMTINLALDARFHHRFDLFRADQTVVRPDLRDTLCRPRVGHRFKASFLCVIARAYGRALACWIALLVL
jgi:hypothetical protein